MADFRAKVCAPIPILQAPMRAPSAVLQALPWSTISAPLEQAEVALARLDQALYESRLRDAWIERVSLSEGAAAAMFDLAEQTDAQRIALHLADSADHHAEPADAYGARSARQFRRLTGLRPETSALADVLLELSSARPAPRDASPADFSLDADLRDSGWKPLERLDRWLEQIRAHEGLPSLIWAALALRDWHAITPFPAHSNAWGRFATAFLLRRRGKTRRFVLPLSLCLRCAGFVYNPTWPETRWIPHFLRAIAAGAERSARILERMTADHRAMTTAIQGRRAGSNYAPSVEIIACHPVISAPFLAKRAEISTRTALAILTSLADEGLLVPAVQRDRFRLWMPRSLSIDETLPAR